MMFFLEKVKKSNRKLYWLFLSIICVTFLVNVSKIEVSPFYVWRMYSKPQPIRKENVFYILTYNNKILFNKKYFWNANQRLMLAYTIPKFTEIEDHSGYTLQQKKGQKFLENKPYKKFFNKTPIYKMSDGSKFPIWVINYLTQLENREITNIKIIKITSVYENNSFIVKNKQLILSHKN